MCNFKTKIPKIVKTTECEHLVYSLQKDQSSGSSSTSIYKYIVPEKPYCAPRLKDLLEALSQDSPDCVMKNAGTSGEGSKRQSL